MISTQIYINFLFLLLIIFVLISIYAYFYEGIDKITRIIIIWYMIILILNVANIIGVLKFYKDNKNRKGPKGPKGSKGPRGFRGENYMCSSCGDAGIENEVYAGVFNDNGKKSESPLVKEGKCIFPFSHEYQYKYKCVNDTPPPGILDKTDASIYGWCATEIDEMNEPTKFGYCNANQSIQERRRKEALIAKNRKDYMKNNYGIIDVDVVSGNTTRAAREKCNRKSGYIFDENDLNEGSGGKFIHLCYKKGYGSTGIQELKLGKEQITGFKLIDVDLNQDSGSKEDADSKLFLYKKTGAGNYIKDIKIVNDATESEYSKNIDYEKVTNEDKSISNLNHNTGGISLYMYVKKADSTNSSILPIDSAFVYKKDLYFFRGTDFFKMNPTVTQGTINVEENYPKSINQKWGKVSKLENFNTVFTYGYNNKTYFFKGSKVYIYDDKKSKITKDSPKNIKDVFPGIPNNISAAFTWGKDGKTYFFKGPFYYKYDDKNKKVARGYPKKTALRWPNMPPLIDAIFTLPFNLGDGEINKPTYVISGERSYFINPSNDKVQDEKSITDRFNGLNVINEKKSDSKK